MAQAATPPLKKPFELVPRPQADPLGEPGVRDAIAKELNWLVERDSGICSAALYSHTGDLVVHDTSVDWLDESEHDAFYEDLGRRDDVLALMEASHKIAGNKAKTPQARTALGRRLGKDITALRITLDDTQYIGVAPIFKDHSYFVVVVVLDREGYRSTSTKREVHPYRDLVYRGDLRIVRESITDILSKTSV